MTQEEGHWTMTQEAMLDLVDEKRRARRHPPIEHNTMITRLVLRSQVVCPGVFDFRAPQITLTPDTLQMLEALLNEQFDLNLSDVLKRHATFHAPHPAPAERGGAPSPESLGQSPDESTDNSILGRLKRLLGIGG